jgi:hypothetical protein
LLVLGPVPARGLVPDRVQVSAPGRAAVQLVGICKTSSTFLAAALPVQVGHRLARLVPAQVPASPVAHWQAARLRNF